MKSGFEFTNEYFFSHFENRIVERVFHLTKEKQLKHILMKMKNQFINPDAACCKSDLGQQKIKKELKNRYLVKPLVISLLLMFFFISSANLLKAQTTFNVGTYAELSSAITSSVDNDIINFTDNVVISDEILVTKALVFNGNNYTITVPVTGLTDDGVFNASPSAFRVLHIDASGKTISINNLIIKGGRIDLGAGVYVEWGSTVKFYNVTILNSYSPWSGGGGIFNAGTVFFDKVKVSRNAADHGGGFNNVGTIYAVNSTFSENRSTSSAGGGGGGENSGPLYMNNCTFSNNKSTEIGGGINNYGGIIYAINSTFTGNVAYGSYPGGAIGINGGTVKLVNSLFAYNYYRTAGTVTSPTAFDLNDIGYGNADAYHCIFQSMTNVTNVTSSVQYTGLADGSDNDIVSGGILTKITDGTGAEIGTAYVFQPYISTATNGTQIVPLKTGGFAAPGTTPGTRTGYSDDNGVSPVVGYFDGSSWVDLLGTGSGGQEVLQDQTEAVRSNPTSRGSVELGVSGLFMLKVSSTTNGTVNGASIYGDVYPTGTTVGLTATPNAGYKFDRWEYVLGGVGTASTNNPYNVLVDRNITLQPVFVPFAVGEYSITYIGNGNTSGTAPAYTIYSAPTTIANQGTLLKDGYSFAGWNTNEFGSGTAYAAGTAYSAATSLTLYAQWNYIQPMTLVFNTNLAPGNRTVTLPLNGTVNVTVNWGDGNTNTYNTAGNKDHVYAAEGTYTVTITGSLTAFGSPAYPNANKLVRVTNFGDLGLTSLYYAFHNASNLIEVPTVLPATVSNLTYTFYNCTNFNFDISTWDVSNVNNMMMLFVGAQAFNQDIGGWDVSNTTNMLGMFADAFAFNQDISSWDVSNVTFTGYMFQSATSFNQNIGNWNVSKVTDMTRMFQGATSFNQNIGNWNVGLVTNMSDMFTAVTLSIANYDALLIGWSSKILQPAVTFGGGFSKYSCAGVNARAILTNAPNNWIITDGGVGDETAPVITSTHNNQTVNANASCQASLPSYIASVNATDNCTASGSIVITQSPAPGTLISGATNTITLRATDGYANYSEVTFNVAVVDATNPVITSTHNDQTVNANASCGANLPNYTVSLTATDNCTASGSIVKTQSPAAGTTISGATNTITLRATDASGNFVETSFNVAVVDNTAPVITSTHNNQTVNANASCQASLPSYTGSLTATDNCTASGSIVITQSPAAGTTISGATNTITLRATDGIGNYSEVTFNVAVVDNTNPTVITQNITVSLDETGNAAITADQINNGSSDNCSIASMSVSPNSFSCANTGGNTVTLTVFDASGNSSSATATVTVQDLELPQLVLPSNITTLVDVGLLTAVVNYDAPYGTDNCNVASINQTAGLPSGSAFPLGVTVNTFEAIDASGNTYSASFEINVVMEESMVISVSSAQTSSCDRDLINIDYTVTSGTPVQYRIIFSQEAKNAGFVDIPYSALTETISFAPPALVAEGNYQAQIQFRNATWAETELYSINFTINMSSDYIVAKFDDVVLCDNKENRFVSYQWYKNGVIIDGATNQYYNDLDGLSGNYSVTVLTTDGQTIHSCERYYNTPKKYRSPLTVYPNPVKMSDKFVVKTNNLSTEDLKGAHINIYNTKGVLVYSINEVKQINDIRLSINGEYYGLLVTQNGIKLPFKLIVID